MIRKIQLLVKVGQVCVFLRLGGKKLVSSNDAFITSVSNLFLLSKGDAANDLADPRLRLQSGL